MKKQGEKTNSMEIKKVAKSDRSIINDLLVNHIANLENSPITISHLEKLLKDDRSYLFAAIIDNIVVGYTLAYRFPSLYAVENLAYLYDIEVLPKHRKKGIGRQLIKALITHLKNDEVNELWLGTAVDNISAQSLFTATGGFKSGETFYDYTYNLTNHEKN